MKRLMMISGFVLIALPGMAQTKSANAPTIAIAAQAAPHYPKSATERTLKTWVRKYPTEAKKYQEVLVSQMSTATPDSKTYSDAKTEFARISQIVTVEGQNNPAASQSEAGIRPAAPGLIQTNR